MWCFTYFSHTGHEVLFLFTLSHNEIAFTPNLLHDSFMFLFDIADRRWDKLLPVQLYYSWDKHSLLLSCCYRNDNILKQVHYIFRCRELTNPKLYWRHEKDFWYWLLLCSAEWSETERSLSFFHYHWANNMDDETTFVSRQHGLRPASPNGNARKILRSI